MVVKVFCGEEFSDYEHEWNQFKEVRNLIEEKYANTDELIYILSNFRASNRQIDVLILTEKGIAILDLKSYKGEAIGNENGGWKVIVETGKEVPLKTNLFGQLKSQRFAFLDKLNLIHKEDFENIDENSLAKIQCWGYFEKGSSYDIEQIGRGVRKWFDVVSADNLIEKMRFLNAGYELLPKDMDAIVKGLHLKEYSFVKKDPFEIYYRQELNVFIAPKNWDEIYSKIKNSNIVTLVGEPRVGKTTTIVNIAKEIKKELGYEIRYQDKEKLQKLFNSRNDADKMEFSRLLNDNQIFILDDLFGVTEYESTLGNAWVKIIIKILESADVKSKFIIGSRIDVMDEFFSKNKELSYAGLSNIFRDSIIKLDFSDYDNKKQKEVFDRNLNYIQLEEEKKRILNNNLNKILHELVLPGEIWHFLENVRDNKFKEGDIDKFIDKAKKKVHFTKELIKSLKHYEKIFLYNLYINKNFDMDNLEILYSHYSPSDLTENYFNECIRKFEGNFIKNKIENELFSNKIVKKMDFTHPVYIESIERLLKEEVSESEIFDKIIFKLHDLLKFQIAGWDKEDYRYSMLQFNIFKSVCHTGHEKTKDLIFEILNDVYLRNLEEKGSIMGLFNPPLYDEDLPYYIEFLNNYKEFKDDFAREYLEKIVGNKAEDPNVKYVIAHVMALNMDSKPIKEIRFVLNKFERDPTIELYITVIIIKNSKVLDENELMLLNSFNNKDEQITLLIQYYNEIDDYLKNLLINQVSNSEAELLMDAIPQVLINYDSLPSQITDKFSFIFKFSNEKIKDRIKEALELWIDRYINDLSNEVIGWSNLKKEVKELFISWLREGNYSKRLYGYSDEPLINIHERLFYKWIFYSSNYDKYGFLDKNYNIYRNYNIYVDEGVEINGNAVFKAYPYTLKEKITPRLREPIPQDLIPAIQKNIILLLGSLKSPLEKAEVMWVAFLCIEWGNFELINSINKAIVEDKNVRLAFFGNCKHFDEYPFKLSDFQREIVNKMSENANEEIQSAYEGFIDKITLSNVDFND